MKRLLGILCRFRGHRWGKARARRQEEDFAGIVTSVKVCRRCGLTVPVKRRAK